MRKNVTVVHIFVHNKTSARQALVKLAVNEPLQCNLCDKRIASMLGLSFIHKFMYPACKRTLALEG